MKKINTAVLVFYTILISILLTVSGCDTGLIPGNQDLLNVEGKLMILQAYGNGGSSAPGGISHSFVELYNNSNKAINLNGISLYYANGITGYDDDVTGDEDWKHIPLNGTIPANGSFLILGAKHALGIDARYKMEDGYGDINDENLVLSRTGFKVALIKGTAELTVQNPFSDGLGGNPVFGYIDMIGAVNNPLANPPDHIFGYETKPAHCSDSEAVRRVDPVDNNYNEVDFIAVQYDEAGITDDELELLKPRNSRTRSWDPFANIDNPFDGDYSVLILNEISGEYKYVEIYNSGLEAVPLRGLKLQKNGGAPYGSEWIGYGSIPAKEYRLITFNGYKLPISWPIVPVIAGVVDSDLSDQEILKISLVDPAGNSIDTFIRGEVPLPPWGQTVPGRETGYSYSRMNDGTWAYSAPSPYWANGDFVKEITDPGYLGLRGKDPPVISALKRDPIIVVYDDAVTVSAAITTNSSVIGAVVKWTLNGNPQSDLAMAAAGNIYSVVIPAQSAGSAITYWVLASNDLGENSRSPAQSYTTRSVPVDYSKLILNEISGSQKFVEIYNSGTVEIPLEGTRLQRNDGSSNFNGSEWTGAPADTIPAGAYRIFLFNAFPAGLDSNPAYTGWKVNSEISNQEILKIAIVEPKGSTVDYFIRGNNPPAAWGNSVAELYNEYSYSRMTDGSWAYAAMTPGIVNGSKEKEIANTGYLTPNRHDPPVITGIVKSPSWVTANDLVTVSASITAHDGDIYLVYFEHTIDGNFHSSPLTITGNVYSAEIPKQDAGTVITYWFRASNYEDEETISNVQSFTVADKDIDYDVLVLNEVNGNSKYVEIYNSGTLDIPMENVKIQVNASEWKGSNADYIPAKTYRIILFDGYASGLDTNSAYKGWKVNSGISSGQILKAAIVDPSNTEVDVFIRGNNPLPQLGSPSGVTQDTANSYSRMPDNTWAYAAPTPGAVNGAKLKEITEPGYLTLTRTDPPAITNFNRNPVYVSSSDTVTVSANITVTTSTIYIAPLLKWTSGGTPQTDIPMTQNGSLYSAVIPARSTGIAVTYYISAVNSNGEISLSNTGNYTVADYSKLILNEVNGNSKYVEIYNSGSTAISLEGVKLQRNDGPTGGSEWVGTASDSIPPNAYRLILFNSFNPSNLADNPAYTGWTVNSGISPSQILKVALVSPAGDTIDSFIRGNRPLPAWGISTNVSQDTVNSYSRMADGTWIYAAPTPGAANGTTKAGEITEPGYLTLTRLDPPVISEITKTPLFVNDTDNAKITAKITVTESTSAIGTNGVTLYWALNGGSTASITMTQNGSIYSADIPKQISNSAITYWISATATVSDPAGSHSETSVSKVYNYIVNSDYSKLVLNEISGNSKYVEIYNSGSVTISLDGVKLERNDGLSEWTGAGGDSIPADAYRLFLFNSFTPPDLIDNPAYKGWTVNSGISDQQILKVALIDPAGDPIDVFIRGDLPLPAWGVTVSGREVDYSYSRMNADTWAYAAPTPGAANGAKTGEITNPGYLTATRINPPVISNIKRTPALSVIPTNTVTITAAIQTAVPAAITAKLEYKVNNGSTVSTNMTLSGGVYSGNIPAQSVNAEVKYSISATNTARNETTSSDFLGYKVVATAVNYNNLVLNEVSGEHKYVEIYNKGSVAIPMEGVVLQRNDGPSDPSKGSEWIGKAVDSIPAGAYRIFLFNSFTPGLDSNSAFTGWTVSSGISDQQILKVALIDPAGDPIDTFIRGDNPLPPWQSTDGVTRNRQQSYSRMTGNTWAYADPTPGEVNGPKVSDIVNPAYLTSQAIDPPVITGISRSPAKVNAATAVSVTAAVTVTTSTISSVVLSWTKDGVPQTDINMTKNGSAYTTSSSIPGQSAGTYVTYRVIAKNNLNEISMSAEQGYAAGVDYTKLKLNEVSGVGADSEKFYELYNTGSASIPLAGCQIFYNANSASGGAFPPNDNRLTWTGSVSQVIGAGQFYSLIGRDAPGSFTTGLTDGRILIITLMDPDGNEIDHCIRAADTGTFAITKKSFSRIPNGTGPFFFTEPTPDATNGTSTSGLTQVPATVPVFVSEPVFSSNSGLYPDEFELTLTAPAGCTIYYSIDGSIPLAAKVGNGYVFKYTVPIEILDRTGKPNILATQQNILQMYPKKGDLWTEYEPTNFYPSAAQVPKATVIRAQAVDSSNNKSAVITKTYFIGTNLWDYKYGDHLIMSVVTDPANLVDTNTGIMVRGVSSNSWAETDPGADLTHAYNFQRKGREWERDAFMELFVGDEWSRNVPVSTGIGIRIRGGYSRGMTQKSLSVYFRDEYGTNTLNYPLIPNAFKSDGKTILDKYKNFALRNGGNDAAYTKFYDIFAQDILSDRNFSTQGAEPCIVYLNGEYWGPYNIQEKYSDNHTEFKYGIPKENVIAYDNDELSEGLPGDELIYKEMLNVGFQDMSNLSNYADFCALVDIDNLIDYCAAQIYLNNEDWPHNNFRSWRTRTVLPLNPYADTKWRWQLFDLDCIMGVNSDGKTVDEEGRDVFQRLLEGTSEMNLLIKSLMKNPEFSRKLVNNIMDLYNVNFHPDNFSSRVDYYVGIYKPLMGGYSGQFGYFDRWGYPEAGWDDVFDELTGNLYKYLNGIRTAMTQTYLPNYFGSTAPSHGIANLGITASGLRNVTLAVNGANGSIKINTVTPKLTPAWTGQYYSSVPVNVTAIAPPGYKFSNWSVSGCSATSTSSSTTTIDLTGSGTATITANFTAQ